MVRINLIKAQEVAKSEDYLDLFKWLNEQESKTAEDIVDLIRSKEKLPDEEIYLLMTAYLFWEGNKKRVK